MPRRTKRPTRPECEQLPLTLLDPKLFPNLAAVRAFVEGEELDLLLTAIGECLVDGKDAKRVPADTLSSARTAAWYALQFDIPNLLAAAHEGVEVQGARVEGAASELGRIRDLATVAIMAPTTPGLIPTEEMVLALLKILRPGQAKREAA